MATEARKQICPKCQSENVVFSPNEQAQACPGDCETDDPMRLQPDCCVGDECVRFTCNECGYEW